MNIFQFTVWFAGSVMALFFSVILLTFLHDLFNKEDDSNDSIF